MSRVYSIEFDGVAVSAAVDFFEVVPAANKPFVVHAIYLSQSSDVGDAAEEILRVRLISGHTTTGSGGAAATPRPLDVVDAAAGATAATNNTTIASVGTAINLHSDTFNIRTGWVYIPTPETRPRISVTDSRLVIRLMAAPADALTMSGTIYIEEL